MLQHKHLCTSMKEFSLWAQQLLYNGSQGHTNFAQNSCSSFSLRIKNKLHIHTRLSVKITFFWATSWCKRLRRTKFGNLFFSHYYLDRKYVLSTLFFGTIVCHITALFKWTKIYVSAHALHIFSIQICCKVDILTV